MKIIIARRKRLVGSVFDGNFEIRVRKRCIWYQNSQVFFFVLYSSLCSATILLRAELIVSFDHRTITDKIRVISFAKINNCNFQENVYSDGFCVSNEHVSRHNSVRFFINNIIRTYYIVFKYSNFVV